MAFDIADLRESFEYDTSNWQDIRKEATTDMAFVAGDPWTKDDKSQRKNRPTVAPEEMSQYRNQVINALMANPRGMKFSPVGNGANDKGAQFYQSKAREIEYRSHAKQAYILAADNALQRSYGFVRVTTKYANPRSANQDLWIEGFPNPDMVLPDTDALRPDGADMKRCFVHQWMPQSQFKREYPKAKVKNFGEVASQYPSWVKGDKILLSEFWTVHTTKRKLLLVQPMPPPELAAHPAGQQMPQLPPIEVFKDELDQLPSGGKVVRELRDVDYPAVRMYLTNGLELLHEQDWPGKYIPIVSCFGKVLYIDGDQGMTRTILSMTRFGRDPWKSYCYACSQELEVLAMVPKAPLMIARGAMNQEELALVAKSMHEPVAALTYDPMLGGNTGTPMGPPQRADYLQGGYLQAIEEVKEGFRRAIQAAMGSNFLPTQAQKRNEKSGVALDRITQAAASGTYHFVNSYEDMIRQVGVVCEDLMDKIYDYTGDVGVMEADGKASSVRINDRSDTKAISTKGDYLATVSTAPSSDSDREAAADFTDSLVQNIQTVMAISGQKVAAAVFAQAIRMRNLGPAGDALADLVEPPEFKSKDGQPPNPQLMAAMAQIQHLTQQVQQAGMIIHTKQVEGQTKYTIEKMKVDATSADKAADRETKIAVAEIVAQAKQSLQDMALFYEERSRIGAQLHEQAMGGKDAAHNVALAHATAAATSVENAKDRVHQRLQADAAHQQALDAADQAHQNALEQGDQSAQNTMAAQQQAADLAPPPEAGA